MKKLNKNIRLSAKFKKWYARNKTKKYNSSNDPYYYDVFYELLIIQEGLCAYTEFRLIDESLLKKIEAGYKKGEYTIDFRPQIPAQLEHFCKKQKKISGWDWNNLFVAFTDVNLKKNKLEDTYGINGIVKPDNPTYNPTKYFMYNTSLHIFFPNSKLSKAIYNIVFDMIIVLGLNNDFIKMQRREYLNSKKEIEYLTGKTQSINQFHTAYGMM